jgi:hypothetical protein
LVRPFITREKPKSKQVAPLELQYPDCLVFYKQSAPPGLENCLNRDLKDERIIRIGLVVDQAAGFDLHLGVLGSSDLKTMKLEVDTVLNTLFILSRSLLLEASSGPFEGRSALLETCSGPFESRNSFLETCSGPFESRSSLLETCSRLIYKLTTNLPE